MGNYTSFIEVDQGLGKVVSGDEASAAPGICVLLFDGVLVLTIGLLRVLRRSILGLFMACCVSSGIGREVLK